MPLVAVDRDLSPTIPNVRCANEEDGRTATGHLLERGARRPALLTSRAGAGESPSYAFKILFISLSA